MPICNPIKRSAALLQSRYDSLPLRGTDRESGATQVCLLLGEGICVVKIHTITAGATTCVYVCEWGGGGFSPSVGLELDLLWIQSDQQVALTRVRVAGLT